MKKIIILTAISLLMASSAFAADVITISSNLTTTGLSVWGAKATAASGTGLIGKTSTGVGVGMKTAKTGYAVVTQHKNGTKAFGSSFDSTSIYSIPVTTVGTAVTGPTSADSALFTGSWTSM
jgi:opacity protein-like surface antigen